MKKEKNKNKKTGKKFLLLHYCKLTVENIENIFTNILFIYILVTISIYFYLVKKGISLDFASTVALIWPVYILKSITM